MIPWRAPVKIGMSPYPGHTPTDEKDPILAACLSALRPLNGATKLLLKCLCSHWVVSTCSYRRKKTTKTNNMGKQEETDERRKDQGSPFSNPFDVKGRCYSVGICTDRKNRNRRQIIRKPSKCTEKLTVEADSDLYSPSLFISRTEHHLTSNIF